MSTLEKEGVGCPRVADSSSEQADPTTTVTKSIRDRRSGGRCLTDWPTKAHISLQSNPTSSPTPNNRIGARTLGIPKVHCSVQRVRRRESRRACSHKNRTPEGGQER